MNDAAVAHLSALRPLISHALELPPDEREPWLDALRAERPALAAELEALLIAEGDPDAGGLLDGIGVGAEHPRAREAEALLALVRRSNLDQHSGGK